MIYQMPIMLGTVTTKITLSENLKGGLKTLDGNEILSRKLP